MISNERPSPFSRRPFFPKSAPGAHYFPAKPPVHEDTLKTAEVQVERKTFIFTLKENLRGRLLRITEDSGNRHNSIIIPVTGLADFQKLLAEMSKASAETPSPADAQPQANEADDLHLS